MKQILVVKVGNDERPATSEDIKSVEREITEIVKSKGDLYCGHHALEFETVFFPERDDIVHLIKVGNDERPATEDDIKDIHSKVAALRKSNKKNILVTHHAVEFSYFDLPRSS